MAASMQSRRLLRGVVFDMDGTLTKPNLNFGEMYRRCGIEMDKDILEAVAAMAPPQRAAAQGVIRAMEEESRRTMQLMPGARELVRWLHLHSIPTAIVTRNTASSVAHLQRELWSPLPPFEPAISRDDATLPPKPHPAALHEIASRWGVPCDPCILMVGDSASHDVGFGKAAGVSTCLLAADRESIAGVDDGGADFVVDSLARLPYLLFSTFKIESRAALPLEKRAAPSPEGEEANVAAARGDVAALEKLSLGQLDYAHLPGGNTPLIWAADAGHEHAVRLLLRKGVSCNARGYLGATAVSRACRAGHAAVLSALLEAPGIDVNLANDKMQTPLHFAAFNKRLDVVRLMLGHEGCNPFVLDRKGRTPAEDTRDETIRAAITAAQDALLCAPEA